MGELDDLMRGHEIRRRAARADALWLAQAIAALVRSKDPQATYDELSFEPATDHEAAAKTAGLHPPADT